jgi:chromosome segregation ATPase
LGTDADLPGVGSRGPRTTGAPTSPLRERDRISDRLQRVTDRMHRLREEAGVLAEQVAYLRQVADDARVRSVVSSTPVADREADAAARDVANHERLLDEARTRMDELRAERDTLLERLFALGADDAGPRAAAPDPEDDQ